MTRAASETIILPNFSVLLGGGFASPQNTTGISLSFSPTGGSFSISVLAGTAGVPPENTVLSLPLGRLGTVKNTGAGISTGGLVTTIGGPALPLFATQQTYLGVPSNVLRNASSIAGQLGASWNT